MTEKSSPRNALYKDFTAPPFTTLDARSGWWQARKKRWLALGIQSELGRLDTFQSMANAYKIKNSDKLLSEDQIPSWAVNSIFDPVLTELLTRWFSPRDGKILDPYAGGSVRGIVASKLQRHYTGWELRSEQIEANKIQAKTITTSHKPTWKEADSVRVKQISKQSYDCILTCPPYGSLEVYSNDPRDISTMPYDMFIGALKHSFKAAALRLKQNRFFIVVVGEFRDKHGHYHGFIPDVVKACEAAGLSYYNEAIYLQALGTLPIRVRGAFTATRKLGKSHQNILIFVKGNAKQATQYINESNKEDIKLFE